MAKVHLDIICFAVCLAIPHYNIKKYVHSGISRTIPAFTALKCPFIYMCLIYSFELDVVLCYVLSYHFNTEAALFTCLSSGWVTTTGRLLGPKVRNSIKVVLNPNFQTFSFELRKKLDFLK